MEPKQDNVLDFSIFSRWDFNVFDYPTHTTMRFAAMMLTDAAESVAVQSAELIVFWLLDKAASFGGLGAVGAV